MIPLKDENPTSRFPVVTLSIVAACIFVFFFFQNSLSSSSDVVKFNLRYAAIPCELATAEPLSEAEIVETFSFRDDAACVNDELSPAAFPDKNVYLGVLTSMFLHGGIMHLLGNMWSLWIFGNNIEDRLGYLWYALFYAAGGVAATAAHYALQPDSTIPIVGASGAISAVMGAYAVWYPRAPIKTIVFLVFRDIQAIWFLGIWFVTQFFLGSNSGIAWMAHVGGFVFGVIVALILRSVKFGTHRLNKDKENWDYTGGVGRGPLSHPFDKYRGY